MVEVQPDTPAGEVALAVADAWHRAMVVHVTGVSGTTDLLDYYDKIVERLGRPMNIAEDATAGDRSQQRSGERWTQVRYDPAIPDAYRHSQNAQPLHTDGSYIPDYPATLMMCINAARKGGETVFLDGRDLVEVLRRRDPALLARLRRTVVPHARSGDAREEPVVRDGERGDVLLNWNYYCVDPSASPEVHDLAEQFFAFLRDDPDIAAHTYAVAMRPGDGVIWKDDRVLHGRNAFIAQAVSERFLWKCAVAVG